MPEVRKRLGRQGFRLASSTPAELAKRIDAEVAKWRELVEVAGIEVYREADA
jgi:tripartite-type tricarboxylate transporter receptor subunit TctC